MRPRPRILARYGKWTNPGVLPARSRDDSAFIGRSRGRDLRRNRIQAMRSLARSSERRNAAPAGAAGRRAVGGSRICAGIPGEANFDPGFRTFPLLLATSSPHVGEGCGALANAVSLGAAGWGVPPHER